MSNPTIVIDCVREPDGSDVILLRGVFTDAIPPELLIDPPAGTVRQTVQAPAGEPLATRLFKLVVRSAGEL